MPFTIIRNDITKLRVDAIVNAANTDLAMGGGVCGAIFKAAGAAQLQAACDKLAPIKTGEAVITPGFGLSAKFVIHAAGPVYRHWTAAQNEELL
jgi:O-acetyl-ADP-ribose deacetylase (regulator of RNase III)